MKYILCFVFFGLIALGLLRAFIQDKRSTSRTRHAPPREPELAPSTTVASAEVCDTRKEPQLVLSDAPLVVDSMEVEETESPVLRDTPEFSSTDTLTLVPEPKPVAKPDLIIVHVFAAEGHCYRGYELLQALLSAGLRYSRRGMFHRYADINQPGSILFSLVSAVEPGIFDLATMGNFATPGLTLFLQTAQNEDPLRALELLLRTAQDLVDDLGGALYDERRQPLRQEQLRQWRDQLQPVDA